MGRPPIGERAMTSAERQRRFLARLREQPVAAPPKAAPQPPPPPAPDEPYVRLEHLRMYPVRVAQGLAERLGPEATRALRDALDQALGE